MRQWIVALMILPILAVLAPELPARTNTDWDNVKRLKQGSSVEVLLRDGTYLRGNFDGANDAGLEIAMADRNDPQISITREVQRSSIRRIVQVRMRQLPDSKRWMITGAIADGTHGTNYRWLAGGLGGAMAGFLGSCVVLAAVTGVEGAKGGRRTKV